MSISSTCFSERRGAERLVEFCARRRCSRGVHGALEFTLVGFVVGEEVVEGVGDLEGLVEIEFAGL